MQEPGLLEIRGSVVGPRVAGLVLGEAERRHARRDLDAGVADALADRAAGIPGEPAPQGVEGNRSLHARVGIALDEAGDDRAQRHPPEPDPRAVAEGGVRVRGSADEGDRRAHRVDGVDERLDLAGSGRRAPDDGHVAVAGEVLGGPPLAALVAAEAVLEHDHRPRARVGGDVGGAQDRAGVAADPRGVAERRDRDRLGHRFAHPRVVRLRRARVRGRGAGGPDGEDSGERREAAQRPPRLACE